MSLRVSPATQMPAMPSCISASEISLAQTMIPAAAISGSGDGESDDEMEETRRDTDERDETEEAAHQDLSAHPLGEGTAVPLWGLAALGQRGSFVVAIHLLPRRGRGVPGGDAWEKEKASWSSPRAWT